MQSYLAESSGLTTNEELKSEPAEMKTKKNYMQWLVIYSQCSKIPLSSLNSLFHIGTIFNFFLFFILFKLYYLIVRVGQYQRKPEKDTYEPEPIKTVERVK